MYWSNCTIMYHSNCARRKQYPWLPESMSFLWLSRISSHGWFDALLFVSGEEMLPSGFFLI